MNCSKLFCSHYAYKTTPFELQFSICNNITKLFAVPGFYSIFPKQADGTIFQPQNYMIGFYIAVLFLKSVLVALQNASKSIDSDAIFKSIQTFINFNNCKI